MFVSRSGRKTGRRNITRTPLVEVLNTNKLDRKQESRTPKSKFEQESRSPKSKFEQDSRTPKSKFEQESRTPKSKFEQESRAPKTKVEQETRTPKSKFEQESRIVQSRRDQETIKNHGNTEENSVFHSELEFEPLIPPAETNTQSISLLSDPSGRKKRSLKANPGETERYAASDGSETENNNTQERKHFISKRCHGYRFSFPFPLKSVFVSQHVRKFSGFH